MTKKTVTLPGGSSSAISSSFDTLSRLSSLTTPVSNATYSYLAGTSGNTTTLVSSVSYAKVNSNSLTPVTFSYTYDAVGNILTASQTGNGTTTYTYDQQGQLLSETTSGYGTRSCEYDTYGNIRFKAGNAYLTLDYDDSQWRDLLTSVTYSNGVDTPVTVDLTYDESGNPLTYYNGQRYTMTWRNGRELNSVTTGGKTYSYEYDVNGLRTSKVVDGVTHNYIYAGGKLLREQYGTTTLDFLYDVNGSPYILQYTNGSATTTYYYITNLQGDVVRIVDTSGATVAQYRYDAWGTLLAITDSTGAHISSSTHIANINPLRYRGYYYDTETKFYYLQTRYYDPEIGRFINADGYASTGQGFLGYNMFAYCNNNPVSYADEEGTSALLVLVVTMACLIATANDMENITRSDDKKVTAEENPDGSIKIQNSKSIVTPWVRFGYAFHLNHFSKYNDNIKGTTMGVCYEWELHNFAYYGSEFFEVFGADMTEYKVCAKDVDVAATIFDDSGHGAMGTVMKLGYSISNGLHATLDFIVYLLN